MKVIHKNFDQKKNTRANTPDEILMRTTRIFVITLLVISFTQLIGANPGGESGEMLNFDGQTESRERVYIRDISFITKEMERPDSAACGIQFREEDGFSSEFREIFVAEGLRIESPTDLDFNDNIIEVKREGREGTTVGDGGGLEVKQRLKQGSTTNEDLQSVINGLSFPLKCVQGEWNNVEQPEDTADRSSDGTARAGEGDHTAGTAEASADQSSEQTEETCNKNVFDANFATDQSTEYPIEITGEYCSTNEPLKQMNVMLEYERGGENGETFYRGISIQPRNGNPLLRCESNNCDSTSIEYEETQEDDDPNTEFTVTLTNGIPSPSEERPVTLKIDLIALHNERWLAWTGPTNREALQFACSDRSSSEAPDNVSDRTARFIDPSDYNCIFEGSTSGSTPYDSLNIDIVNSGSSTGGEGFGSSAGTGDLSNMVCSGSQDGYQWGEVIILEHEETLQLPEAGSSSCATSIRHTNLNGEPTIWFRKQAEETGDERRIHSVSFPEGPTTYSPDARPDSGETDGREEIDGDDSLVSDTQVEIIRMTGSGTQLRVTCSGVEPAVTREDGLASCQTTGGQDGQTDSDAPIWVNYCTQHTDVGSLNEVSNIVNCLSNVYGDSTDNNLGDSMSEGEIVRSFCNSAGVEYGGDETCNIQSGGSEGDN